MIKNVLRTKVGSSIVVAAAITMASGIGVASAHHSSWFKLADEHSGQMGYYSKDQCKDGGWKQFKDANGHRLFKNQGECVSFFAKGGQMNNSHHGDGDNDADDRQSSNNHNNHHHWWDGLASSFWHHH